jgi:periplasmic divalent cation tolerance protein
MSHELIAFVTTSNKEEAARIASSLVTERLAACVNILSGIESVYRWEGEVARDSEMLLIIKTTDDKYLQMEQRVKELHSYTTPEVIAFKIERGSNAYLDWLRKSVSDVSE